MSLEIESGVPHGSARITPTQYVVMVSAVISTPIEWKDLDGVANDLAIELMEGLSLGGEQVTDIRVHVSEKT